MESACGSAMNASRRAPRAAVVGRGHDIDIGQMRRVGLVVGNDVNPARDVRVGQDSRLDTALQPELRAGNCSIPALNVERDVGPPGRIGHSFL